MNKIQPGSPVPDFSFECTDPNLRSFKDLLGQRFVLYFYPKDNTPHCTLESKDFSHYAQDFSKLNTRILGVSRDTLSCHVGFSQKHGLSFPLITDPDEKLCNYFDVVIKKNWFLRLLLGIERTTFLIDEMGVVRKIWRNVKVNDHAKEVLKAVTEL